MQKILIAILCSFGFISAANAGMFDDLVNAASDVANKAREATKSKEMLRVELPLTAIKKKDVRVKKIESLAVQVAIKHKWKLQVACPNDKYCKKIKQDVDAEAWRVARSKVSSDYAAKAKLPMVEVVQSKSYAIALMRKGL